MDAVEERGVAVGVVCTGTLTVSPASSIVERGVPLIISGVDLTLVLVEQDSLSTLHNW